MLTCVIDADRALFARNPMIYGQFLEHFHRQIYGGVYDPASPRADADGLRTDVLDALREIRTPIIRWPGGCFVSAYDWKKGVGRNRPAVFDKAWRVEEPNTFGTDEFIALCRKLNCEPYICTNAGTGRAEAMSDWVEYCNMPEMGEYARLRKANGHSEPFGVKYWSIGNENYGSWEIGAYAPREWSRLVLESAKMMKRADPSISLSAAALDDLDWNCELLKTAGGWLDWISLHAYWDGVNQTNALADYLHSMAYTVRLEDSIRRTRGLLTAFGLEKRIKISFDEWNLRGWYHPNAPEVRGPVPDDRYYAPRDDNDLNATYNMADAIVTACFLNALLRNGDLVQMACYAPAVNTRGLIYTWENGIVKRSTFHVFSMYVNMMGDQVLSSWRPEIAALDTVDGICVDALDIAATRCAHSGDVAISIVNKHPDSALQIKVELAGFAFARAVTLCGKTVESYNDVHCQDAVPFENTACVSARDGEFLIELPAHSVNVLRFVRQSVK